MDHLKTKFQTEISPVLPRPRFLSILKAGAFITHNATEPLNGITGDTLSDHMLLPNKSHKMLYITFSHTNSAPL